MFSVGQHLRFSEWLQVEMDKRGWSQSDCARAANLNRAVINKLLNGKSKPQPSTLVAISRAFKIPIETIYRAAGLLPQNTDPDDSTQELMYILKSIQSPSENQRPSCFSKHLSPRKKMNDAAKAEASIDRV